MESERNTHKLEREASTGHLIGLTLKLDGLLWLSMTFEVILIEMKYLRINDIGIHINFYQNQFINERVRKILGRKRM